jgi:hypothetical protein
MEAVPVFNKDGDNITIYDVDIEGEEEWMN